MTKEIRTAIKDAYQLKGTTFSFEFDIPHFKI